MNRARMLGFAVALLCVVAIGSYYLFGGRLNLSLFFPAPSVFVPKPHNIPTLRPVTPGPTIAPAVRPAVSPTARIRPSMRVPGGTDVLLRASPPPYAPSATVPPVTPPPAPTYVPVTPPPYGQVKPIVGPATPGVQLPGSVTPQPSVTP